MGKEKNEARLGDGAAREGQGDGEAGSRGSQRTSSQDAPAVAVQRQKTHTQPPVFKQIVQIDNRSIEVNYGTKEEFTRLLNECAREAATDISRPNDARRKFFRCIHCGDSSFSNKMRLNKHRWDLLCPAVKDDMGNPKRLMPYPDQGRGQGKVSEMIRKGKDVDVAKKVIHRSKPRKEVEVEAKVIPSPPASKPKKKAVRKREDSPPVRVDTSAADGQNSEDSDEAFIVRRTPKQKQSTAEGDTSRSVPRAPPPSLKQTVVDCPPVPVPAVLRSVSQRQTSKGAGSPPVDPVWGKRGLLTTKATQVAGQKRKPQAQMVRDSEVSTGQPEKRLKGALNPHSKTQSAPMSVLGGSPSFQVSDSALQTCARKTSASKDDFTERVQRETLDPETLPDQALGAEGAQHWDSMDSGALPDYDQGPVSPDRTAPSQVLYLSPSKSIVSWSGDFEGNAAVQRFWMCSFPSPKPHMYHPALTTSTLGRAQRLQRDERKVQVAARVKADELAASRPRICPPIQCEAPDLYHLLQLRPELLDWSYNGQSAQDFKDHFAQYWVTDKFKSGTRECVMWWTFDAKEEDYPDVCQAVGRAVASLAQSVKYEQLPPDIPLLADYLQYLHDSAMYEEKCQIEAADIRRQQETMVAQAVAEFRRNTRLIRESNLWDWCPIWWVVKEDNIFPKLPSLPWKHDDEEADEVRGILLAERVPRQRPPHFVQVLRLALNTSFGRWRQLTCPVFGVNREMVRSMCKRQKDIMLALSNFTYEAQFRFAGMASFEADVVHNAVMKDAQLVCEGKEDRIMDGIMQWAQNVRLRALQDLALHFPTAFKSCWTTTMHEHWGEQSKHWARCLRIREDCDLGWVADDSSLKGAGNVQKKRQAIKDLVQEMEKAFDEDDTTVWEEYSSRTSKAKEGQDDEALQVKLSKESSLLESSAPVLDPGSFSEEITVSQLCRSVHVDDILTQDLDILDLEVSPTPSNLIGIVCKENTDCVAKLDVISASARSLESDFAAVPVQGGVNPDSDEEMEPQKEGILADPETLRRVTPRKRVTFAPSPTKERDSKPLCRLSISVTYDNFKIEELMDALPRKGKGELDAGVICFYGGQWDSLPVPMSQLRDLRRCKRFLDQNVFDLLSRRLWYSLSSEARGQVYVASSFMQVPLQRAWDEYTDDALVNWGRLFLVPSRIYSKCPPHLQVLVPYIASKHWSLFIFTQNAVLHLDSIGMHNEEKDKQFLLWVRKVWELLHEPPLSLPPNKEDVHTFVQKGNYECGFCVLRFMEAYLRVFHGDDPILDNQRARQMFQSQVDSTAGGPELQKNIIAAVADELGCTLISELYEPPYRMTYVRELGDVESSPEMLLKRSQQH